MRRYGRTVVFIAVLVTMAALILAFQRIDLGDFERGDENTPLGLSLGLDLQGGSHLIYEADLRDQETGEVLEVSADQMEALLRTIERRVNASGLGEPIIQRLGDNRLLVQLPGITEPDRAKTLIGETARLEFKRRLTNVVTDLADLAQEDIVSVKAGLLPALTTELSPSTSLSPITGVTSTGPVAPPPPVVPIAMSTATSTPTSAATSTGAIADGDGPAVLLIEFTEDAAAKFEAVLSRMTQSFILSSERAQEQGAQNVSPILLAGGHRLDVTVAGVEQLRFDATILTILPLDTPTVFAFSIPPSTEALEPPGLEELQRQVGENAEVYFSEFVPFIDEDIGLTGDDLARAFPSQHTQTGEPVVNIEFNERGTKIFGEQTVDIVDKRERTGEVDLIAIFLDGKELIAPSVDTPITVGTGFIRGRDFTIERVRDLALLLESGRLPIPIKLIRERDVDAILGKDSLEKSVVAGFVGLGLVLLFMALYYRFPGVLASMSLLIYVGLVLAIFKIMPVTLTLSGVAAVILSVGMAVDANILIFERMKEELRAGRTLLSSINIGFDRAWPAIRDGNVSTLITCGILFWFADQLGATIVQGFAVTLAIGVVISMFSAITVSRTFLRLASTTPISRRTNWWTPSGRSGVAQQATAPAAQRS